jgi:hypothetical protein
MYSSYIYINNKLFNNTLSYSLHFVLLLAIKISKHIVDVLPYR